ncbi:MAG TPA: HIT domain-containing protein [Candidatus Aminicenantes bacterium]|nr:HIT domain-containing protein [Candidatus Aminicenantes bacterium]
MRYIATPWREDYVRNVYKNKDCVFCKARRRKSDDESYILCRGSHNFIMLNKFPYTTGHLMIIPNRHMADFEKATPAASAEFMDMWKLCLKILRRHYSPHGFNAGMNLGRCAGAGIAEHFHLHVIPRWTGDSNFLPLLSRTRIIVEDLETTYERLKPLFNKNMTRLSKDSI